MCSCVEWMRGLGGLRSVLVTGAALAAFLATAGCAQRPRQQPVPPPMEIDQAMLLRDWEPSVAYIPSGNVIAGVNRFPLRTPGDYTAAGTPDYGGAVLDYGAHLIQTVALPFTYLFVPPFEPQVYAAEPLGLTYTGMEEMQTPSPPVEVDDLQVDPQTLEVLPPPARPVYE